MITSSFKWKKIAFLVSMTIIGFWHTQQASVDGGRGEKITSLGLHKQAVKE